MTQHRHREHQLCKGPISDASEASRMIAVTLRRIRYAGNATCTKPGSTLFSLKMMGHLGADRQDNTCFTLKSVSSPTPGSFSRISAHSSLRLTLVGSSTPALLNRLRQRCSAVCTSPPCPSCTVLRYNASSSIQHHSHQTLPTLINGSAETACGPAEALMGPDPRPKKAWPETPETGSGRIGRDGSSAAPSPDRNDEVATGTGVGRDEGLMFEVRGRL